MTNHPPLVIARSKATWQSTPTPSLREAKRRGNQPQPRHCEEHSDVAIHTNPVIARSKATWQTIPIPSLRGAKRRGNPYSRHCKTKDRLLRLRLAMTVGMARNDSNLCHCEERSDAAIYFSGGAKRQMDCFAFGSQ